MAERSSADLEQLLAEREDETDAVEAQLVRTALLRRMFGREQPFPSLGRFRILRRIGAGGMGVVYEAFDPRRDVRVALKTLQTRDPRAIAALKREFRSLAEIRHPNLVRLHELFVEPERIWFSMELVSGPPLAKRLAGRVPEAIRRAFAQIAKGVEAMHRAGKLHLDLKPSNVATTTQGRIVLLDFGLAREMSPDPWDALELEPAGTPGYMAPEQLRGFEVGPATDWFAVGVMLHEMLTGSMPPPSTDLRAPPSDQALQAAGAPGELARLCIDLLHPIPAERPLGSAILERLGTTKTAIDPPPQIGFVGRQVPLRMLASAHTAVIERGRPRTVVVTGPSGIGKTALVRRFASRLGDDVIVLGGRWFPRESNPHGAFDGLVDALAATLRRWPEDEIDVLADVPDVGVLPTLFPVLGMLAPIARAPVAQRTLEPRLRRLRAFAALRALLSRVVRRAPLVLALDDLQWANEDAADLLGELLRPPDAPPMLVVATARTQPATDGPSLGRLLDGLTACTEELLCIELGPLETEAACTLVARLSPGCADRHVHDIVRESGGNPLFLETLARSSEDDAKRIARGFEELLAQRVEALPPSTRRLFEVACVAEHPLGIEDLLDAAGLHRSSRDLVDDLSIERLLRISPGPLHDSVEPFHARIGETMVHGCTPARRRAIHCRLAAVLSRRRGPSGILAGHFESAGASGRAAVHAERAGDEAAAALAFDRAADWYARSLARMPADSPRRPLLARRLAEAAGHAGHGLRAAEAYLEAAALARDLEARELRRLAAEQLLRTGHLDRGRRILRAALADAGIVLPEGAPARWVDFAMQRARLRWRRLRGPTGPSTTSHASLEAVDACWAAVTGFGFNDMPTAAAFCDRGLRLALEAGEPTRIVRWLAMHTIQVALGGSRAQARAAAALERAREASNAIDGRFERGMLCYAEAACAHSVGRWALALRCCDQALDWFERCHGAHWERTGVQILAESALFWLGDLRELDRRVRAQRDRALEHQDRFALVTRQAGGLHAVGRLALDRPDEAARDVAASLGAWSCAGVHLQHWYAFQARVQIELYRGPPGGAWNVVEQTWPLLRRSRLHRAQVLRVTSHLRRACAAIDAASAREPDPLLETAQQDVETLRREDVPWASALAELLDGARAAVRGERRHAHIQLDRAARALDRAGLSLFALAARARAAALADDGAPHVEDALEQLRRSGVHRPAAFLQTLCPGPDLPSP